MRLAGVFLLCLVAGCPQAQAEQLLSGITDFARVAELHPQATGVVAEIYAAEGDRVQKGDLLVSLDAQVQAARVEIAAAAVASNAAHSRAQAQLDQARSRHERIARAVSRGGAAQWELTEAKIAIDAAEAEVAAAEEQSRANAARLGFEEAALEQFSLRAPFSGLVLEVNAELGGVANGSDALVVMADDAEIEVEVFLPAELLATVEGRARLQASLGPPVVRETAVTLISVDPRIEPASNTVRAVFGFPDGGIEGLAGVEVSIRVPDGS
ncbi:MAG: efflux RND transporter periplasmic adaptor subunit [Pseudomonadota bacterium]